MESEIILGLQKSFEELSKKVDALIDKRITQEGVMPQAIKSRHLASDSVGTDQIQDGITLTTPIINSGSDATGDIYYRNVQGEFTPLPVGTTGQFLKVVASLPAWGSVTSTSFKVGATTRTVGTTGAQSITGIGFQPTFLITLTEIDVNFNPALSIGVTDGTTTGSLSQNSGGNVQMSATNLISIIPSVGTDFNATFTSFDADGFTITWTKTGAPLGTTVNILYIAK